MCKLRKLGMSCAKAKVHLTRDRERDGVKIWWIESWLWESGLSAMCEDWMRFGILATSLSLLVFFFLQAHSDTSRCWWMWIQTFLQHNFMLFFYCSSKLQSGDLYHLVRRELELKERSGAAKQKKSFHHLMNFKSHLKLSVNLSNNLNNSSHSLTELVGWVGKLETRQENLRF